MLTTRPHRNAAAAAKIQTHDLNPSNELLGQPRGIGEGVNIFPSLCVHMSTSAIEKKIQQLQFMIHNVVNVCLTSRKTRSFYTSVQSQRSISLRKGNLSMRALRSSYAGNYAGKRQY